MMETLANSCALNLLDEISVILVTVRLQLLVPVTGRHSTGEATVHGERQVYVV
jgi:hypothetical protein